MITLMEHGAELGQTAPTPEALAVHEQILPLATELSVLNPYFSARRDRYYGEGLVQYVPLQELAPDTVPGVRILCRDECRQLVGSYKLRGATAAVDEAVQRDDDMQRVVTYSAGNHAQGVAQAARAYGIPGAVVETFSYISPAKEARIQHFGGVVHKQHRSLEEARDAAQALGSEPHTVLIPPFDHAAVMAGGSTMMSESVGDLIRLHQAGGIDLNNERVVFPVPGGGGGASAGMASMLFELKQTGMVGANLSLVVAQMEGCDAITRNLGGETLDELDTWCDGTAVREPGAQTMAIIRDPAFVQGALSVPKGYVGRAMQALEAQLGHPVEPAGALSLAYVMYMHDLAPMDTKPPTYVVTISGGNVSPQTQTHFANAAFELSSQQYAERTCYGLDELLDNRAGRTSRAAGLLVLGGSGR